MSCALIHGWWLRLPDGIRYCSEVQVVRVFAFQGGVGSFRVVPIEVPGWCLTQLLAIVKGTKAQRQ